jgi:hypothetical protein
MVAKAGTPTTAQRQQQQGRLQQEKHQEQK